MPYTKFCNKCDTWKDIREFHRDKYSTDGYTYHCKECRNTHHQEYREKTNSEKDIEYKKEVRSNKNYVKNEYRKHTEWQRKNAEKLAKYEKMRRDTETKIERSIRLAKMRLSGRRRKYRGKVKNIIEFAKL